ncbi:exported hypothetical protein [Candidatus Sulfopaludibacter sp. SbA3]|nr:exported hypothetical protein [Candidatus Sulfopaludibacter sp. SbA3]
MIRASRVAVGSSRAATVALVGYAQQEQDSLRVLFDCYSCPLAPDCGRAIRPKASVDATMKALRQEQISVVLCDRDLEPDTWKSLLQQFAGLPQPPCLIVTSRTADEYLWAEALNLGAYDVLARPFDRSEFVRTISLARLHWQNQHPSCHAAGQSAAREAGNDDSRVSAA